MRTVALAGVLWEIDPAAAAIIAYLQRLSVVACRGTPCVRGGKGGGRAPRYGGECQNGLRPAPPSTTGSNPAPSCL